ncbi:MAG TPA: hypothetical protein VJA18_02140 [Candidatus Nanoarchaeia archaeon]|nr:hypothetical protein [Candidatus Nanoarchaeia archaeon]
MRFNKKGSLELSIQAIVIVVIAFTVLGLGLGFVKSQLGGLQKTASEVQSKIKEQILEDMRVSGKKVSVTSQITLERGSQVIENVGIVNTGLSEKVFGIKINFVKKQNPDGSPADSEASKEEIIFFYSDEVGKRLSPTAGDVLPITISAKSGAAGNYLYKVDVYSCPAPTLEPGTECELYDTRSFFVRVA